jgi:hypothetical protein
VRLAEDGWSRDLALLTVTVAALLLAGHPETTLYALAALVALAVTRALGHARPATLLGRTGAALALAFLLAAPGLLPAAHYLPQSLRGAQLAERAAGVPPAAAGPAAAEAAAPGPSRARLRLVPLAAPSAFGSSRHGFYWGEANSHEDASGFAGTPALLLLLLGLALPGPRRRAELLLLAAAAGSLLLLAPPAVLAPSFSRLGLLAGSPSGFHRLLLLVNLAAAALGAFALARWQQQGRAAAARAVAAALALAALLVWAYGSHPVPPPSAGFEIFHHGWMLRQLKVLGVAAALLLVGRGRSWLPFALSLVLAVELFLLHAPFNPPMPRRLAFPTPGAVAFLQAHQRPGERMAAIGDAFRPNLPSLWGLAEARVFNPVEPAAYHALTRPLDSAPGGIPAWEHPDHPLYDLLGVRWLFAAPERELPGLALRHHDASGRVYERPSALPRLFLPTSARIVAPRELLARTLEQPEPARRSVVVASQEVGEWSAATTAAPPRVLRWRVDGARVDLLLTERRLLASSIYQDGGWRIVSAAGPLVTTLANGPFVAAWVPPGDHQLELLHRPPGLLAGAALAALGLGAALCWWLPQPRTESRRRW